MGNLAQDTAVEGGRGRYRAVLSEDWRIWGPNGGYLAVIALRAAGAECTLTRPASFACQYLSVAEFGPVDLEVTTLRASRGAAALRVTMTQQDRPVLAALAWIVAANRPGLAHDVAVMPDVPAPEAVPSYDERWAADKENDSPGFPFWDNLESREVTWVPREQWGGRPPNWCGWLRFRPAATFSDPFVDAGRSLLLIDTLSWPAAAKPYQEVAYIAPSLDVNVQFHRLAPADEWLLCDAHSPLGEDGLLGTRAQVWSRTGVLLASGISHLLCRPLPT